MTPAPSPKLVMACSAVLCATSVVEVRATRLQLEAEAQYPKWPLSGAAKLQSDVGERWSRLPFVGGRGGATPAGELPTTPKVLITETAGRAKKDSGLRRWRQRITEKLGSGSHSTVYACSIGHTDTAAVKVMDIDDEEVKQQFAQERNFLASYPREDYVVGFRGSMTGMTSEGRRGFIFLEKADGTLQDVMRERRRWPRRGGGSGAAGVDGKTLGMAVNMLRGLQVISDGGFVHGDIVPSNIFIFGDWRRGSGRVKFGDFGQAGPAEVVALRPSARRFSGASHKLPYVAPEFVRGLDMNEGSAFHAADVWAAGMVLTELFTGSLPANWEQHATEEGWSGERGRKTSRLLEEYIQVSVEEPQLQGLLRGMLQWERRKRFSPREALRVAESYAAQRGVLPPEPPAGWADSSQRSVAAPEDLADAVRSALPWRWFN